MNKEENKLYKTEKEILLQKISNEIEKQNIIEVIKIKTLYGGLTSEYANIIDNIIIEGITEEFDELLLSNPLYEIVKQLKRKNTIEAINFRIRYGGLKSSHVEVTDKYIEEYLNRKTNSKKLTK